MSEMSISFVDRDTYASIGSYFMYALDNRPSLLKKTYLFASMACVPALY